METKAKLPKKLLSMFLALLMMFSACYAGVDGIYAFAAVEDSEYTANEVAALINAATADGSLFNSSGDMFSYHADDGKVLAAAEAIFDYAVNAYREGNDETSTGNSSKALYDYFTAEFQSKYTHKTAADRLVKSVLYPDGTAIYSYESPAPKSTDIPKYAGLKGSRDVTADYPLASFSDYYADGVASGITTKSVDISVDLTAYLKTFDAIDDIPSSVITNVKYTYAHGLKYSAYYNETWVEDVTTGEGCDEETTSYYTATIDTSAYNYMESKPNRKVTKDNTIKKTLLAIEKYFNADRLAMTQEEMLALPLEDINNLYSTTEVMYKMLNDELGETKFTDAALNHFGLGAAAIHTFMENVDFAYRVSAAKHNIDNLNTLIGTEYNEESYAEMSALYAKTNTAYNVVFNLKQDVITYLDTTEYAEKYDSAIALKATAESFNSTLFDVMTEQKLEETVAAMVKTFQDYINVLDKEDIDNPNDAEVIGLDQKVDGFDAVIASYTGKAYYRTYWKAEYESEWNRFKGILAEVYEVRGLKAEFQTHYDFFLPLIYTTQMDELDNEGLIALHGELETKLTELRDSYNAVEAKWGGTIADKIFTVTYDSNGDKVQEPFLLQTLVESVDDTGKEAAKEILIARTEAQLDAVYAYKDTTTVTFENFASIKSTLTYFDQDLYNYVNGGGEGQNSWLSSDYTNKYAMVQTLLDRYHAFSTTNGESSFNHNFTFADENGNFAVRPAGDQVDNDGNQIGYPNDIARDGADDNYYVTEDKMLATVAGIDRFVNHRDFGALLDFVDEETEDAIGLKDYINQMLEGMLYTDEMMNTIVGAIFPMICELIEQELVGAVGGLEGATVTDGVPWLSLRDLLGGDDAEWYMKLLSGTLGLYLGDVHHPNNPAEHQNGFMEVFKDIGLNIYPASLAESLMMSNPIDYGVESPIYIALKAAGRDWTQLVMADDPETPLVDETKAMEFEWGVYDEDTFIEVMGCILDSILPLLQAVLTDKTFEGSASNAAVAYSEKVSAAAIINATDIFIRGGLKITIDPLNAWNTIFTPLFEVLGIEKIPTVKADASGYDIAEALIGTLLGRVEEILASPLSNVLSILPNLVYFISMDTIQEMLNGLNIHLKLNLNELDVYSGGGLGTTVLGMLEGTLSGKIEFPLDLKLADEINLYDMLRFEISDFNEILNFALGALGGLGGEEGGLDLSGLTLPPIRQQDIIFCSEWPKDADGKILKDIDPTGQLVANEGELMYWFLDYVVKALAPDENGNSLLTSLLGSDMDPRIQGILNKVVSQLTGNQEGALAAIIELLNPTTYDLQAMNWLESQYDYGTPVIEGAAQMSIVYLNYGNDWTREKAEYLTDNVDSLVATVMEMVEADLGGAESIGAFLADKINAVFTNDNITALVKMLGGLGDSPSAVINDVVKNQVGIDIESWFTAFGYLYPAETWAEDAEIIPPGHRLYVNNFGVEGVANEDGTISWSFNKMPLVDGDGYTFVNILSRLIGPADLLIKFLFAGEDVSAFEDLLTIKGYETYDTSLGLLLEMLGVENLPTQADFDADAMGSFTDLLTAVLDWFYALTSSETMIKDLIEVIPDLFYFIESNGLSTLLHNLLMPIWVLVDTVRPLIDVDINGVLSLVVSEFLNYGTLNIDTILQYIVDGIYQNPDLDFVWYNIDINNITFSEIIKLADLYLGTNLYNSGLVQVGIKGFCSGLEKVENTAVGTVYKPTIDAADTITLLVTALLDCLSYPAADKSKTNGDAIFELIAEMTENEKIAGLYPVISELIAGIDVTYTEPNWGYMFETPDKFDVVLPQPTIGYLEYATDWTPEAAADIYAALDEILDMVLPGLLEKQEASSLAALLNGIIADEVYSDEILTSLVETVVNLLADFNAFFGLVDGLLGTSVEDWFAGDFCQLQDVINEETGETEQKWVCVKDFGIDEAPEAEKKAMFIAGLKSVLAPVYPLLDWLLLGGSYEFFTGSKKDENGNFVEDGSLITLNGGEGYAYGLAPIFEALGIGEYEDGKFKGMLSVAEIAALKEKETANTGDVIEYIIDKAFQFIDKLATSESTVKVVFDLLPNLIYFINANGLSVSIKNLLAPAEGIIAALSPVISEDGEAMSVLGLIAGVLPENMKNLDLNNLTMTNILNLVTGLVEGLNIAPEIITALGTLYVGNLKAFTSANKNTAYRLDVTGAEGDVLTLVLSLAIEIVKTNGALLEGLIDAETYAAIIKLLNGLNDVLYTEINWAYMYEDDAEDDEGGKTALQKLDAGFPYQTIDTLEYTTDWTETTAEGVYGALKPIVDMVLPEVLGEHESLLALIQGLLNDEVYTDKTANALIELIVNAIAGLDESIMDIIDAADSVLGADVSEWFKMCTLNTATDKYECTVEWGITGAADPQAKFIEAVKTVIAPANDLLAWLFFADSYTFFNGVDGESVLVTLKGGEGYANALVPLFEALGCTMQPKSKFYNEKTDKYDVGAAIEGILMSVLAFAEDVAKDPIKEVFELLPNLIYFINADGVKAVVNNLLAPVNSVLATLEGVIGEMDLGALLVDAIGFNITDISTETLLKLAADNGVVIPDDVAKLITELYVGAPVKYESVSGLETDAYRVDITGAEHDILTIVLTIALDVFNANDELFGEMLKPETYAAVKALLKGLKVEYMDIDWAYMYEDIEGGLTALEQLKKEGFPEVTFSYLDYENDWTEDAADVVYNALDEVLAMALPSLLEGEENLKTLVEGILAKDVYKDEILISVVELLVNAIADFDRALVNGVGALLAADINVWFEMCEKVEVSDTEGVATLGEGEAVTEYKYKVTDETIFLVDEATTPADKKDEFIKGLQKVLKPANELLNWLFFGGSYSFLNSTEKNEDGTNKILITLNGGKGYEMALVPLFEALGVTMAPASEFLMADGETYDVGKAVASILNGALGLLDKLAAYDTTVEFVFTLLPNLIYFINAGGAKAVVNNLLAPATAVLNCLSGVVDVDINELLGSLVEGLDIANLTMDSLLEFAAANGVVLKNEKIDLTQVIKGFYVGDAVGFTSANNKEAFRVDITTNEDERYGKDVLTVILSLALDVLKLNRELFAPVIGEEIYDVIYKFLNKDLEEVPMKEIDWILTDKADSGEVLSPVTLGGVASLYGELYTREMGQYIETFLPSFVDTMIVLLGIEAEDGTTFEGLEDILNDLIGSSLYTKANLEAILEAIQGLIPTLEEALGAELYPAVVNVLDEILGVDLGLFSTYTVADFADGDKEAFVTGLVEMLEPVYPILSWLLTDEELIALFYTVDGDDAIVIEGANGYAYGIVPLLEAFDYDNEKILDPDAYKAASKSDPKALLRNILNPILDVVDQVLADPVNEIFNVLPGVIYFLNSNGLDTVIRNTLNAVVTVLHAVEPITDGLTVEKIYEMIGFNGKIDIVSLLEELLAGVEEDTGFKFADVAMDAIESLTVGEVIETTSTSKNGFIFYDNKIEGNDYKAYTMKYATGADRVDMVTVILRAVLTFISVPENVAALEGMLADSLDEEGYKFVSSLLENFSQMAAKDDGDKTDGLDEGMDEIMYTVYHIFYAANVAAHSTEDWLGEFNGDYSFLNQLFATSDLAFLRQLEASLGDLLNKYTGDIIDDDEVVPNGFIAFFQKIAEFFKKIGEFFKNLFK